MNTLAATGDSPLLIILLVIALVALIALIVGIVVMRCKRK